MKTVIFTTLWVALTAGIFGMGAISAAQAGWDGRTDMFGTHWRNNQTGQSFTCRQDMFGTHCN